MLQNRQKKVMERERERVIEGGRGREGMINNLLLYARTEGYVYKGDKGVCHAYQEIKLCIAALC